MHLPWFNVSTLTIDTNIMKLSERVDAQNLAIETHFFLPDLSCDIQDIIIESYSVRSSYLERRSVGFLDSIPEAAEYLEYVTDGLYSFEEYVRAIKQTQKDASTTHVRALEQRYMLRVVEYQMKKKRP